MRSLASSNMTEDFKTKKRFPTQVQAILSASDIDLSELSLLADKIYEVVDVRQVSAIVVPQAVSAVSALTAQIEEVTKRFSNLNKFQHGSKSRSKSRSDSTSRSNKIDMCWYYRRFQERVKKCISPCSFNTLQKKLKQLQGICEP